MTRSKSEAVPDGSTQTPEGLPRRKVLMMAGLGVFSALLDVSLFNEIDYDGEEENVIYADKQLGFVAVSGYDKKTKSEYVRIVSLSSQEGITLLDEARTRTAERNQLLLKPKQPNE